MEELSKEMVQHMKRVGLPYQSYGPVYVNGRSPQMSLEQGMFRSMLSKSEKALFEEPYEGQLFFEWSSTLLD